MILLLLAAARLTVIDGNYEIARDDWNYVEVRVVRAPTTVHCEYAITSGPPVRLVLVRAADLDALRVNRHDRALIATPYAPSGRLRHVVDSPGDYAVAIENRQKSAVVSKVRLTVWLESERVASTLPRARRAAVIGVSLALFAGALWYAWRKLSVHLVM